MGLKKFLLFAWGDYMARGGFLDFLTDFDILKDAVNEAVSLYGKTIKVKNGNFRVNNWQIVDSETKQIIVESDEDGQPLEFEQSKFDDECEWIENSNSWKENWIKIRLTFINSNDDNAINMVKYRLVSFLNLICVDESRFKEGILVAETNHPFDYIQRRCAGELYVEKVELIEEDE